MRRISSQHQGQVCIPSIRIYYLTTRPFLLTKLRLEMCERASLEMMATSPKFMIYIFLFLSWSVSDFLFGGMVFLYGLLYSPPLDQQGIGQRGLWWLGRESVLQREYGIGSSVLFHCTNCNRFSNSCVSLTACFQRH
jgi:hypothetical protein